MAKATKEFRVPKSKSSKSSKGGKNTRTSVAYRTVKVAREKQKREIEQQKREKLIFALFVVVILVMIIFAILVFKKMLGSDVPEVSGQNDTQVTDNATDAPSDTPKDTDAPSDNISPATNTDHLISLSKDAVNSGNLVFVSSNEAYQAKELEFMKNIRTEFGTSSSGKTIYSFYLHATDSMKCNKKMLELFSDFADDFYAATGNLDLYVKKAYSSGSGVHSSGLVLDLEFWAGGQNYSALDDSDYTDEFKWLKTNAHKYGFVFDSGCESKYSVRYVGTPHAYYMYKHDLDLKDYLDLVKGETVAFTTDSGEKYEVSYVHATGDVINVALPSEDAKYEISGDNMEGIILTVQID